MTSPIDALSSTPYATGYTPYGTTTTDPTDATTSTGSTGSTGSSDNSALDPQAFLQLLVAQLQYQDPSSPADMSSFMTQTATLSQTQAITSMQQTMQTLLTSEQSQAATSMIGQTVTYTDSSGATGSGVVTGATGLGTSPQVLVGNQTIPIANVTGVSAPAASS